MNHLDADKRFAGSIPAVYESHLVPQLFEPYATDIAERLASAPPTQVLEVAAGTGVVTRALATALPKTTTIVATDLNQAMIDVAVARGTSRPVTWRQADAMALPFADGTFDAVVCQFGVMFFPDKRVAYAEARRVLRPGGRFVFNVWDRIQENEFSDTVSTAVETVFPGDPPRFLTRTPYAYHDHATIQGDLAAAGFSAPATIATVTARSRAASSEDAAIAICQGTPLRAEIEARGTARLLEATAAAAEAIAKRFGRGRVDGKIQAHVVTVVT